MIPRRKLLKKLFSVKTILAFGRNLIASNNIPPKQSNDHAVDLYRSINGTPGENLNKVIEMMGGDGIRISECGIDESRGTKG